MPFVWSIGTIVGPSIGGYFAEPAISFPDSFGKIGIFRSFPYLLPNLICAALMLLSIAAGWMFLEETHPDMQPWSTTRDLEESQAKTPLMPTQAGTTTAGADLTHESYGTFNNVSETAIEEDVFLHPDGTTRPPSPHEVSSVKVFTRPVVMLTIALGIFTYHSMTYDHLFPIFLQDRRASSHTETMLLATTNNNTSGGFAGGLGLSIKDVGVIMSINGLIALFTQAVIFPLMAGWLGVWKVFLMVTIGHPVVYFIVPWLVFLPSNLLYPGLFICMAIRNFFGILAYPVLLILIKEASPSPNCLGKINGLAASTGAACRTIASPIAGLLYGFGINLQFTALAWWASALVAIIGACQVCVIDQSPRGDQHRVRPAMSFSHENPREHRPSIVHIRVRESEETNVGSNEDTHFASRVPSA